MLGDSARNASGPQPGNAPIRQFGGRLLGNALSVNALSYPGPKAIFTVPREDSKYSDMESDPDHPDAHQERKYTTRNDWLSVWETQRRSFFSRGGGERVYC